jgi:hypothetical protein
MDNIPRRQPPARRNHRFAGLTAALPGADRLARFQNSWSTCPVDRSVNTTAAEQ